jgi:hypothetical protein
MNRREARESGLWRPAIQPRRGLRCRDPSAWVAHCIYHLPDCRDDQLRVILVDVVPAFGREGVVRVGDELREIAPDYLHQVPYMGPGPKWIWEVTSWCGTPTVGTRIRSVPP